jgi:hypothetical protein
MSEAPRLSFDKNLPDELQIVNSPQGLPFLQSAEPAPATRKYTKPTVTEAQAGNVNFPLSASDDDLAAPSTAVRGGLGREKNTEGGKQQKKGGKNA